MISPKDERDVERIAERIFVETQIAMAAKALELLANGKQNIPSTDIESAAAGCFLVAGLFVAARARRRKELEGGRTDADVCTEQAQDPAA